MNNQIFKYGPLRVQEHPDDWQRLDTPEFSKFLHFGIQNGEVYAWFEVNPRAANSPTEVIIIGTGWDVPEGAEYLGTVIGANLLVWHLYRRV